MSPDFSILKVGAQRISPHSLRTESSGSKNQFSSFVPTFPGQGPTTDFFHITFRGAKNQFTFFAPDFSGSRNQASFFAPDFSGSRNQDQFFDPRFIETTNHNRISASPALDRQSFDNTRPDLNHAPMRAGRTALPTRLKLDFRRPRTYVENRSAWPASFSQRFPGDYLRLI